MLLCDRTFQKDEILIPCAVVDFLIVNEVLLVKNSFNRHCIINAGVELFDVVISDFVGNSIYFVVLCI